MKSVHSDYRKQLKDELELRCQKNPRYSLRAFAAFLGISAPRLSHILNGKHGLSKEGAELIAQRLGYSTKEMQIFCDKVESEHARAKSKREIAKKRLENQNSTYTSLEIDTFKVVSDWYHFALLELTLLDKFESNPSWIAGALGISTHEVTGAIERLIRLDMLEKKNGKIKLKGAFTANPAGIPSEAIRKFHRQILKKADTSLETQTVDERDFSTMILAFDEADIPKAKERLKIFRREFDAEFSKSKNKNQIYCLGLNFFKLTEKGKQI